MKRRVVRSVCACITVKNKPVSIYIRPQRNEADDRYEELFYSIPSVFSLYLVLNVVSDKLFFSSSLQVVELRFRAVRVALTHCTRRTLKRLRSAK